MADFYGCLLTTSFRVKDREAFLGDPEVQYIKEYAEDNEGFFESGDGECFAFGWRGLHPGLICPMGEEEQDDAPNYLAWVIRRHILPGDVCQIGVSGNERLSYIGGTITWVSSKGSAWLDGVTECDRKRTVRWLKNIVGQLSTEVASIV
jgi:hypothetical protein